MSFKDSTKNAVVKLRLDSHHAIERFGVFFGVVTVAFVLLFGGASVSAVANQGEQLDSTALYTPTFNTSKTQIPGAVSGVYVNSDKTRAMLLMQFQDPTLVSSNAENYRAFLTGSSRNLAAEALRTKISGQVVVFGTSGYMAMVLDSEEPFQQQILNLTMRANSELVYLPGENRKVREDLQGQKTFSEFDQWRLFFNPGASGTTTAKALDGETFDAGAVYAELVVSPKEKEIRTSLDEQLAQMLTDQALIGEYEAEMARVRVDGLSLTPPKAPKQVAGDEITGTPAVVGTDVPSSLRLKASWVSPSGFDFDWRSGSVAEGYLDDIVPEDGSYVRFLADKAAMSKNDSGGAIRVGDLKWILSDGTDLVADYGNSDQTMKQLFDIRNGLSQAYQDYYNHKIKYQVDSHGDLIDLEVELRNVRSGASVNNGEKALFTY